MKRSKCVHGHDLQHKTSEGGIIFSFGAPKCRTCTQVLKRGTAQYTCQLCDFSLCYGCFTLPVCRNNHTLVRKVCEGTTLFAPAKTCQQCGKILVRGQIRHSCKKCSCHICDTCWQALKDGAPPAPAAAPLAAPPTPSFPTPGTTPEVVKRRACRYGAGCYQKNGAHLERFVHPGDRNYRMGLVIFEENTVPEFESLWQFFQFHDPEESGHISRTDFAEVLKSMEAWVPAKPWESLEEAWDAAGGPLHGYVNFRQFVTWTQALGLEMPIGLEESASASRPCRFRLMTAGGKRCSCPVFQAATEGGALCVCGHKSSMHRSDIAERTFTKFIEESKPEHWDPEQEGLVEVSDPELLAKLQELLVASHKTTHNWTRDRGCSLHGVNGCSAACSFKHKAAVPSGYTLVTAFRNQNVDLWQKYNLLKTAITEECSRPSEVALEAKPVATRGATLESAVDASVNEWYLFHGSSTAKCRSICSSNFRLNLAGSGATWKDASAEVGTPLYGFGIYFAEHVTKADEYSEAIPAEEAHLPEGGEEALHAVLLCRVVGGRANVVTTNEIERDKLKSDVFDGPYHSVYGDRVTTLNKPFREIVVYDKDQCYPEFLLVYTRKYG